MAATTEAIPSVKVEKSLWDTAFFGLSVQQQAIADRMRMMLRTCPCRLGPHIADIPADRDVDSATPKTFNKSDVASVESYLVESLKKEDPRPMLRILKTAVRLLNRKRQADIPTPTRLDRLMADPNLLPKNLSEVQRRAALWANAEALWLDEHSKFSVAGSGLEEISWEMVVASAVFRGGLLSVQRAVAFARALAEPSQHFGCSAIRGYADLAILTSAQEEEVVRWYPNSTLMLLISRVQPKKVEEALVSCSPSSGSSNARDRRIAQLVINGIVAEFIRQGVDPGLLPRSLSDFVKTIAQNLRKEFPSLLLDYATGQIHGPSLLPESIGRINGDPAVYVPRIPRNVDTPEIDERPDRKIAYSHEARSKEPEWMRRLRSAFRSDDVKQTIRALNSLLRFNGSTPSAKQLCTLSRKLLTGPAYGGTGKQWAYGSVRCCILTVARRFALQRKNEDPVGYSSISTLKELYRLAVDEAAEDSRGLQETVAWALRQYHRHLVHVYHAKNIDEDITLRVPPGSDQADANVLSIDDIFKALDYIEISRNRRWKKLYRTVARGLIVLDFLGGLRRAEGLGLTPTDLLPGPFYELMVRDNDIRTLKTENANRCVELGILAHPFSELLLPVRELFQEAEDLGTDLSCGISDDVIVPIVHDALRAVTGLKACHMHTLRHSAAHWTFMRLAMADLGYVDLFPHLPKTTIWLQSSRELRSLLLHSGESVNDSAWAVAAIMGHSNPGRVTFRYYVHSLDIILAQYLEARTPTGAPTKEDGLRGLSGLPHSTAYRRQPASHNLNQLQDSSVSAVDPESGDGWHRRPENEFTLNIFSDRLGLPVHPTSEPAPQPTNLRFWPKDTYDILWMSSELGLSEERLANMFGLDRRDISTMLSRANSILRFRGYQLSDGKTVSTGSVPMMADKSMLKVPKPPKVSWSSESFRAWSAGIEEYCSDRKPAAITFDYIVQHILPVTGQIVFTVNLQPELAKNCLRVFDALGFRRDELQVISCDGTQRAVPTRRWLQNWGISWRIPAINQHGRERLLPILAPWVVVGPKPAETAAGSPQKVNAQAIWFLIRMAAIRFHVESEEQH